MRFAQATAALQPSPPAGTLLPIGTQPRLGDITARSRFGYFPSISSRIKFHTHNALIFCTLQYVVILAILTLPIVLRKRFMIQVPLMITVMWALFGFVAMVMGDGLNFYGKYSWWDSVLHLFSSCVLAFVGLWIITIIFEKQDQLILNNKLFLSLYVLIFGLSCGAVWEVCEYAYDAFCGTNTQQFMATTTASITTVEDIPLCGHEALRDTMTDLILDLVGSLLVSIYVFLRYDKLMKMHQISFKE